MQLVVRDDRQDAASAKQAIRELIKEDVIAIIGPMTSSMAVVVQPLINSSGIVTVSPIAKADQFSGQNDFFYRVTTPLSRNAEAIANHAAKVLNLKRFTVVYDDSNRAFTEAWLEFFKQTLLVNGGQGSSPKVAVNSVSPDWCR